MRLLLALLFVPLLFALGCDRNSSGNADVVTISQLGAATASSPYFNYVGSDNEFHHFVGTDGTHFRVHLSDWPTPSPLPYNGKFSLFMTVKDGKLTTPDAKVMSDLMQKGLVRPPSGMAQ